MTEKRRRTCRPSWLLVIVCLLISIAACQEPVLERVPRSFNDQVTVKMMKSYRRAVKRQAAVGLPLGALLGGTAEFRQILQLLQFEPDDTIADLGCGTGALEVAMLEGEVPFARIYAVDVNQDALDFLQYAMDLYEFPHANKIETVLSTMDDVRLPANSIDVAVLLSIRAFDAKRNQNGILEVDGKGQDCLKTLANALRDDGRIVYVSGVVDGEPDEDLFERIAYSFEKAGVKTVEKKVVEIGGPRNAYIVFHKPPKP
ncbi:MAG: methyltransferase domain-containing protein [Candidatus Lernaella stagnicola]|nr:methyltransferase domain-containing protein [Candidatus Lernaella stagnicola]